MVADRDFVRVIPGSPRWTVAGGMTARGWGGRRSDTAALLQRREAAGWRDTRVATGRLPGGRRSSTRRHDGGWQRSSFGFGIAARRAGERRACKCRGGYLRGIVLVQMTGGSVLERGRSGGGRHDSRSRGIARAARHTGPSHDGGDLLVSRGRLGRRCRLCSQSARSAVRFAHDLQQHSAVNDSIQERHRKWCIAQIIAP